MQILSKRKRNIHLAVLAILFVVGTPFIVLYSIGYRFDDLKLFVKTGGITVVLREPGAQLYIDDEYKRDTNFLQKVYFFQSISTGSHEVKVLKDGYQEWSTEVQVYPELVSETYPLLVEEKIPVVKIDGLVPVDTSDGDNIHEPNEEYIRLNKIFENITYKSKTGNLISYKDLIVRDDRGDFTMVWNGNTSNTPYYFCGVFECGKKISIKKPTFEAIEAHDFYPYRDDALLILTHSGLYVMQVDNEQRIQVFTLYNGENIDFYIEDRERIYIKDGEMIGYLDL